VNSERPLRFPGLLDKARVAADFKSVPADFQVVENLGFEPVGGGEHVYLRIRKTGANTAWVATRIAEFVGVRSFDVNYSGRKDRHAVTEQWFSCWKPGKEMPDFEGFFGQLEGVELLEVQRYNKKLRKGTHASNSFVIWLRNLRLVSTDATANTDSASLDNIRNELEHRLQSIANEGFANYFGEQRFGIEGQNLEMADKLLSGGKVPREQRDMYLSAARSYMFNWMLGNKIAAGQYQLEIRGKTGCDNADNQPTGRDGIKRTGPRGWLYGQSRLESNRDTMEHYEAAFPDWSTGLKKIGMKAQLRDLRVMPQDFSWKFEEAGLQLSFTLPTGSFATELLKELVNYGE